MLDWLDKLLDRITMYRLLIYYLITLLATAAVLSWTGFLGYKGFGILLSGLFLSVLCWGLNRFFGWVWKVPVNGESAIITGLILSLIISPLKNPHDLLFLAAAGGLAIASKYILTIRGKHIFNPAAIAVVLTALGPEQSASWWVGTKYLAPLVIIGGWLVIRKIEREVMIVAFLVSALALTTVITFLGHHDVWLALKSSVIQSSLLFMAFVMLPEPATSPTTKHKQWLYGVLAGLLWPPQIHLSSFYTTPERALIAANAFSFIVSPKARLLPKLIHKIKASATVFDFVFRPSQVLAYQPGQYMEWTLPHHGADSRGLRRYFTLASSPTEKELRIGMKFYDPGSSFKRAMVKLDETTAMAAGHLGGDFTLPRDKSGKLVFIAGGIGVTPYRSMVKYLVDKNERRDIVLIYSDNAPGDFAYTDIFEEAKHKLGIRTIYTLTGSPPADWRGQTGVVSADMIRTNIPDFAERTFYISGPHSMVQAIKSVLKKLDVPSTQIKTDFFPGYT